MRGDTGEQLKGSNGLHGYIIAQDGADAVRFLKTLHARCWLHGLGWLVVSSSGQLLERSIVDRTVGAAERLVFEGPPVLEPPLKQDAASRRPVVTAERSRRLWDEMVPPPTRRVACRLTVSYAGFSGESVLLEELYKRGMALPEVAPGLRAGDGLLMAWHTEPIAPWQTEAWLAEMRRSLRPNAYARMITNEFVSSESTFVDLAAWDACVQPALTPTLERLPIWVGVDASVKRDSTALVACTFDKKTQCVRLVQHRIYTPSVLDPIDFEATVEATLLDWRKRFVLRKVWFDPFQMVSVAQRLAKAHIQVEEYPQTVPNLTAATSNLFDLIKRAS